MSSKPLVPTPAQLLSRLGSAARDLTLHQPTPEQRQARARFWASYRNAVPGAGKGTSGASSGTGGTQTIPLAVALQHGGNPAIEQWWGLPGFQDWWCNSEEFAQRVEYLTQLALDDLEAILSGSNLRIDVRDKIAAAKMVLEVGGKFPGRKSQSEEQYADAAVASMDKKQLEAFISSALKRTGVGTQDSLTDDTNSDTLPTDPSASN